MTDSTTMTSPKSPTGPTGPIGTWGTDVWPLSGHEVVTAAMLKTLRLRRDGPGLFRLAIHGAAIVASGVLLWTLRSTMWLLPLMILHGMLVALLFAPLHECAHGTAFKTRWINGVVGRIGGFLVNRPFLYFRYRHTAHHTFTQHTRLDPDRVNMPRTVGQYVREMFGRGFWKMALAYHWRCFTGRFDADDLSFTPPSELSRIKLEFRLVVAGYVLMLIGAFMFDPWAPLVLIAGPRFFGEMLLRMLRISEHTGTDDSPNLKRNTRTTLVNPVLHYFYWEMPFHGEHHLAPSVPFHALKRLHREVGRHVEFVGQGGLVGVHSELIRGVWARQKLAASHQ